MNSNLNVRSNIYPVDRELFRKIKQGSRSFNSSFIKQIRGKSALKKLAEFINGRANRDDILKKWLRDMGVQDWQIEFYWDMDTPCAYANGKNPHGLVKTGIIECRCDNTVCHLYDKEKGKCGD